MPECIYVDHNCIEIFMKLLCNRKKNTHTSPYISVWREFYFTTNPEYRQMYIHIPEALMMVTNMARLCHTSLIYFTSVRSYLNILFLSNLSYMSISFLSDLSYLSTLFMSNLTCHILPEYFIFLSIWFLSNLTCKFYFCWPDLV